MPDPVEPPIHLECTITELEGTVPIAVGDRCGFAIERHVRPDGSYQCNAQIVCGGTLLFGGAGSGFFACTIGGPPRRDVVGTDPDPSGADGDAALAIDTARGSIEIWDDEAGALGRLRARARLDTRE